MSVTIPEASGRITRGAIPQTGAPGVGDHRWLYNGVGSLNNGERPAIGLVGKQGSLIPR